MTALEAHAMFSKRKDRSILPYQVHLAGCPGMDIWPAVATAAVSLAGCLESAETEEDLDEGIGHYETCVENIGCLDDEHLQEATLAVLGELLEWGEREEARRATAGNGHHGQ